MLPQRDFFYCSLPAFESLAVYEGVKKMVQAYPSSDEEIIRRRWLGIYYQERAYPDLEQRFIDQTLGFGVFTKEALPAERLVGEYTGLVRKRKFFVSSRKDYVGEYTIPGYPVKYIIDAEKYGSLMRFVNHSEEANVYSITVIFEGILRVFFISKCPLKKGEQLLLDYGPDYWRWRLKPKLIN